MKKSLVFLIICFILIIGLIIFFIGFKEKEIDSNLQTKVDSVIDDKESEEEKDFSEEDISEEENTEAGLTTSGAGGGAGGGEIEDSLDTNEESIPGDINARPCGYYFSEYGICNGTCENGVCVQEERSCYCKE